MQAVKLLDLFQLSLQVQLGRLSVLVVEPSLLQLLLKVEDKLLPKSFFGSSMVLVHQHLLHLENLLLLLLLQLSDAAFVFLF